MTEEREKQTRDQDTILLQQFTSLRVQFYIMFITKLHTLYNENK